jgi:hypothetical protein
MDCTKDVAFTLATKDKAGRMNYFVLGLFVRWVFSEVCPAFLAGGFICAWMALAFS